MKKIKTKQDLCLEMATLGYGLYRISRILNVSQQQVLRYLLKAEDEVKNGRVPKPRKPKVKR